MTLFIQNSAFSIQSSGLLDSLTLLIKTVQLRPYVFLFLAAFLLSAPALIGWQRTGLFFAVVWLTAFVCEFSSTRTGLPFGWYHYTGSTVGQELYLSNVPFMDSLSFTMLLYASYCLALSFLLPSHSERGRKSPFSKNGRLLALTLDRSVRTGWPVCMLTTLFFVFIDMVIDPVALRGDRWFLGKIYYYPNPGLHFGVPLANYGGWAVVGVSALLIYFVLDRRLPDLELRSHESVTSNILMGCSLYYGVLLFNLTVTFWIDEPLIGMTGILIYIPLTVLLLLRLLGKLPAPATLSPPDHRMVDGSRLVTVLHRSHKHGPSSWREAGSEWLESSAHHRGDRLLGQDARTLDTIGRSG
ncbi:MAG TPA: carotenoid biosynthesis protein [Nitrospira sp.]|nr:carotenoid biosynthesis protein [Nitrospira sp.]